MEFFSSELLADLAAARKARRNRRSRLLVKAGDQSVPVVRIGRSSLSVEREDAPRLRGFVDIFEGQRHLYQALIVAAAEEGELMTYEFKRNTRADGRAPVDFPIDEDRPAGYLPAK